ncbi:MAG: RNA pseudouridine synthase [Deltaproteobacteria bacterium CG11_big_fil_rev_8_21_14_0_20_45_16]|nr:MAG: RNA pseudouridine synthase [Deltaproteobacteria bacterium CG11_big_fil_rev_8_21_14_0_20_45_16]
MNEAIFKIIHQDTDILVIQKLASFLSQRGDQGSKEGLDEFLARVLKMKVYPVHRLDREVLGLMIFALNPKSAESLSQQFKLRKVEKLYWARVKGRLKEKNAHLVHYLKKNLRKNYVTVFPRETEGAKRAELTYEVLSESDHSSILQIRLGTGRSHQIRAQLAKIGHPIVGDGRYGARHEDGQSRDESIQLQSIVIGISHPQTGKFLRWEINPSLEIE